MITVKNLRWTSSGTCTTQQSSKKIVIQNNNTGSSSFVIYAECDCKKNIGTTDDWSNFSHFAIWIKPSFFIPTNNTPFLFAKVYSPETLQTPLYGYSQDALREQWNEWIVPLGSVKKDRILSIEGSLPAGQSLSFNPEPYIEYSDPSDLKEYLWTHIWEKFQSEFHLKYAISLENSPTKKVSESLIKYSIASSVSEKTKIIQEFYIYSIIPKSPEIQSFNSLVCQYLEYENEIKIFIISYNPIQFLKFQKFFVDFFKSYKIEYPYQGRIWLTLGKIVISSPTTMDISIGITTRLHKISSDTSLKECATLGFDQ